MKIAIALHLISAVIWVGGMFFAYMALRPAAMQLDGPTRCQLWSGVFDRFFRLVWIAIGLLLITGYWMIFKVFGGMAHLALSIHIMQTIGIIMILIFMHVYFAPYRRLKRALAEGKHERAATQLGQIRRLVAINLTLGLINVIIGSAGRYW